MYINVEFSLLLGTTARAGDDPPGLSLLDGHVRGRTAQATSGADGFPENASCDSICNARVTIVEVALCSEEQLYRDVPISRRRRLPMNSPSSLIGLEACMHDGTCSC